jgi:hypothetical protein
MTYSRRAGGSQDWVGGLPAHLPYTWPRCQVCQQRMGFVGQLYAKDWFPIDAHLALQVYVCDDCRKTVGVASPSGGVVKGATISVASTLHLEALPATAAENARGLGVRCRFQPKLYISYTPVEDSMDQWEFNRRELAEEELPDKQLRRDKLGGLFPYDGYESPKITRQNRMIGQFIWQGIGGTVYLYHSARHGIYAFLYY